MRGTGTKRRYPLLSAIATPPLLFITDLHIHFYHTSLHTPDTSPKILSSFLLTFSPMPPPLLALSLSSATHFHHSCLSESPLVSSPFPPLLTTAYCPPFQPPRSPSPYCLLPFLALHCTAPRSRLIHFFLP